MRRLVAQGFRVAVCDQVEDPKLAKGIVRREVIETVTPGAAFADDLLEGRRNNYLCALYTGVADRKSSFGLAAIDLSTGEFRLATVLAPDAEATMSRWAPRELLIARGHDSPSVAGLMGTLVTERDAWEFDPAAGRADIAQHFGVQSLDGFGVGSDDSPVARGRWRAAALPGRAAAGRRAAPHAARCRAIWRSYAAR